MIKVKPLIQFYTAAVALVISGFIVGEHLNWIHLVTVIWSSISGVFLIYRFNDYIDGHIDFKFNFRLFFQKRVNLWLVVQFFLFNVPVAIVTLPSFYFGLFVAIGLIGFSYSIVWKLGAKSYRLKNIFLLKNIIIGVLWGALILLGAGSLSNPMVYALFALASIQVAIGSMIRDISDLAIDLSHNVRSVPVVLGKTKAIYFMHFLNLLTFFIFSFYSDLDLLYLICIIFAWRMLNLIGLFKSKKTNFWGDTINLLTCSIIMIVVLIQYFYGAN